MLESAGVSTQGLIDCAPQATSSARITAAHQATSNARITAASQSSSDFFGAAPQATSSGFFGAAPQATSSGFFGAAPQATNALAADENKDGADGTHTVHTHAAITQHFTVEIDFGKLSFID